MTAPEWHLGIDIGGTWVRAMAAQAGGVRIRAEPVPVPASYSDLLSMVKGMVPGNASGRLSAAGCGVPGTSDGHKPLFVPALPWLEGKPLAYDLSQILEAPVHVANDGQLTLLAEASEGAARGARSAVLVTVGTGIGGALLLDGRIWAGHHGSAGSWGWLPASRETSAMGHGPFERAASGAALSELGAKVLGTGAEELVQAARGGQADAVEALETYVSRLASGIAAIASTLDPEVIIVAGGITAAMDLLEPLLAPRVQALASPDGAKVPVRPAALGPWAGVVGSLLAAVPGSMLGLVSGPRPEAGLPQRGSVPDMSQTT